jgi:signal transduction histidine kinase
MISIINDVLELTKIETGSIDLEVRELHLAEALSGAVSELQTMADKREHTLTINIPPGLPRVRADAARLHQILFNLVSNGIKYTEKGGEIVLDAHEAVLEELPEPVRDCVLSDRRYTQIDVRDTGVGIAPHELDKVFERFYRTENPLKVEAGGTGLGLSLTRPLVELLGGRIWVESTPGEGTTFSFILPAVDAR